MPWSEISYSVGPRLLDLSAWVARTIWIVEPEMMPLTTPASMVEDLESLWGLEPRVVEVEAIPVGRSTKKLPLSVLTFFLLLDP